MSKFELTEEDVKDGGLTIIKADKSNTPNKLALKQAAKKGKK